ncbi:MAG: hypothetical protein ACOH2E_07415 [Candidatus Paracaedibacter sp.]
MLKLVYVNPNPIPAKQSIAFSKMKPKGEISSYDQTAVANILPHFTAKLSRMDAYHYRITVCDPSHYLSCDLILEIRESGDESAFGDVICHFPTIQDEYLKAFVWDDATLISFILVQFYIKILEQLLLFCANHNALKLIIHANPLEAGPLEVYQDFIVHTDQVLTPQGRKTALVIPTDRVAHGKLTDYMEQIGKDFCGILREDQYSNPIIHQYLKLDKFI